LVDKVKPAVVNISTTELESSANHQQLPQMPNLPPDSPFGQFFRSLPTPDSGPEHGTLHALGSGFIVDPAGYIVTNNHVIKNGTNIEVTLQDGTTLKAKVVGHDDLTDLALLKVDSEHPLPYVSFGDSGSAKVGDWVVSVGNPFGLGGTVTAGILSASGRDINAGPYDNFLQIDSPINQGNSGGPTFDEHGNVIGINTAILSPNGGGSVGIGFAIPSNEATTIVAELRKSGKITRGYLGVEIQDVRPNMEDALGVTSTNGAAVVAVKPNGPASDATLKPGDVVTGYNGKSINRIRDLTFAVASTAPGTSVSIEFERGGQKMDHQVKIGELPGQSGASEQSEAVSEGGPSLGLNIAPVTDQNRQDFNIPHDTRGVVVEGVKSGGLGDQAGLKQGDVIEQVNHHEVLSARDIVTQIRDARDAKHQSVAFDIERGGQQMFVAVGLQNSNAS
jgi:serine protease Do